MFLKPKMLHVDKIRIVSARTIQFNINGEAKGRRDVAEISKRK